MTRADIQIQIDKLAKTNKTPASLLAAIKSWLDQQNILADERKRIKEDLNSYEGL